MMLRFPKGIIDEPTVAAYRAEDGLSVIADENYVVIDFAIDGEGGGGWTDDERWMPELSPIREEITRGDLRALYLGWLASWGYASEEDEANLEPPVPPGLGALTDAQRSLVEFLMLDEALVRAAAEGSVGDAPGGPSRAEMAEWIEGLPEAEKNAWLLQVLDDDGERSVRTALRVRFRETIAPREVAVAGDQKRRTIGELFEAAEAAQRAMDREEEEELARAKARKAREATERRAKRREELAPRETQSWDEVDRLIEGRNAHDYDLAIALLEDLLDLAESDGRRDEALGRIQDLRSRHARKRAFAQRLDKAFGL